MADQGEIDIMENRGDEPRRTGDRAYHFGTNPPYYHDYQSSTGSVSVWRSHCTYPDGFHTYAVEWTANKLRFF